MRRILIILLLITLIIDIVLAVRGKKGQDADESGVQQRSFSSIFGIGRNAGDNAGGESFDETNDVFPDALPVIDSFKAISPTPIAGYTEFNVKKKVLIPNIDPTKKPTVQEVTEHIVRYVGRANGYVYEIKNGGIATQVSNIFIPNIYEATFATPQSALVRFLRDDGETIATYHIPVPDENADGTRTQQQGTYLQDGIKSMAVSPDGKSVAQLTIENGAAIVATTDLSGKSRKELLRPPFHSFIVSWPNQSVYLQTKPSLSALGFLYRIDTANKRLLKVIGDVKGLTTLVSPGGKYLLYSQSAGDGFSTRLRDIKTGSERVLSVSILPEKCAWPADDTLFCAGNEYVTPGTYPDDWYAGIASFDDKLYRIIPSLGIADAIDDGEGWAYDATNLVVDTEQSFLYFIDKRTGLLWQFDY